MPSRRDVLATAGTASTAVLAGCSGDASSSTVDCTTGVVTHGNGDLLDTAATATVEDGDVRFRIPLDVQRMRQTNVARLRVFGADGRLAFEIPVNPDDVDIAPEKSGQGDNMVYEQYLGHRPYHGRYRVVAVDHDGSVVDSVEVEFNCFAEDG